MNICYIQKALSHILVLVTTGNIVIIQNIYYYLRLYQIMNIF